MDKKLELKLTPKEDYTSMEKYVLSKLEIAEATIQDLASENRILNERLAKEKHKITLKELAQLKKDFIEDMRKLDEAYYKEHNTYRPRSNDIDEFVNWLELGGFEIYVR